MLFSIYFLCRSSFSALPDSSLAPDSLNSFNCQSNQQPVSSHYVKLASDFPMQPVIAFSDCDSITNTKASVKFGSSHDTIKNNITNCKANCRMSCNSSNYSCSVPQSSCHALSCKHTATNCVRYRESYTRESLGSNAGRECSTRVSVLDPNPDSNLQDLSYETLSRNLDANLAEIDMDDFRSDDINQLLVMPSVCGQCHVSSKIPTLKSKPPHPKIVCNMAI